MPSNPIERSTESTETERRFTLVSLFSRRIQNGKLMAEIDGLRFLAIFLVLLHHVHGFLEFKNYFTFLDQESYNWLRIWLIEARRGVELFFVISGFILAVPFAKAAFSEGPKPSIQKYFRRRLTRLEPPYIIILVIMATYQLWLGEMGMWATGKSFFASLFYIHNISFDWPSLLLPVAWSLELEVHFYLLAPFLFTAFYLSKPSRRLVLSFIILGLPWVQAHFQTWTYYLFHYIQYFLMGLVLADFYLERPKIKTEGWMGIIFGGILLGYVVFSPHVRTHVITSQWEIVQAMVFPLGIGVFYYIVLTNSFWKKVFSLRGVSLIGGMCYSIYLVHLPVISFVMRYLVNHQFSQSYAGQFLVYLAASLPVVLVVGAAYFLLIEKPCMDPQWPGKLTAKLKKIFA
jgi:peptidoglycan/LPS O-acetylase OafA/YrhL